MNEYAPNKWRKRPVVITAQRMREPFTTQTMEGTLSGKAGDWLMTGVRGEQYPCDDGVFRQTYDLEGVCTKHHLLMKQMWAHLCMAKGIERARSEMRFWMETLQMNTTECEEIWRLLG